MTTHRVSAGPYMLELPANGVAILFEDGQQLPGGVGYLSALVQFAGEVIRLREALDESVRLQSHYAALLNDYDGGKRMRFNSDTWLSRLRALREKHDAD